MNEGMGVPTKVACFALTAGIAVCFWQLSSGSLTTRETLLFSTALAVLSIAASWFTSKHYSEQSYTKNLQVFGRKASEKVTNLSNELNKLIAFLQPELEPDEDLASSEALLSKRMRIEAAIHMVGTLKSINEGSLSDWQAVIGDEIVQQKEKQEEKEETLRDILEMMETLPTNASAVEKTEDGEQESDLQKEINSIRSEMRVLATQVSGVPITVGGTKKRKEKVEKKCPKCGNVVTYFQRTKPNSIKALNCPECGISLISRLIGDQFVLAERAPIAEEMPCPNCRSMVSFLLDSLPGSSLRLECGHCKVPLKATRRATVVRLKSLGLEPGVEALTQLSEDLLSRIKEAMGQQPWPTGRSKEVRNQLHIAPGTLSRGLEVLISRGDFVVQRMGKLYSPIEVAIRAEGHEKQ